MLDAITTETTCNERCWKAQKIACRCSCGGKNHSILLVAGVEQPVRMSRRKNKIFELEWILDGYAEALRYTFARGVYHDSDTRMITESAGSRKWPEVTNSGAKHPYLVWRQQGAEIVEPKVCNACGREEEPKGIDEDGNHINSFRCYR